MNHLTKAMNDALALLLKKEAEACDLLANASEAAAILSKGLEVQVHMTHCNQGEYEGGCKYGDDDCPAQPITVDRAQLESWLEALNLCPKEILFTKELKQIKGAIATIKVKLKAHKALMSFQDGANKCDNFYPIEGRRAQPIETENNQ